MGKTFLLAICERVLTEITFTQFIVGCVKMIAVIILLALPEILSNNFKKKGGEE